MRARRSPPNVRGLFQSGTNLRTIQILLGHRSSKTTSRYLHVSSQQVRAIVSPLDSLNLTKALTTETPRELVIAEDIRRLAQQGDLTSACIRGLQMRAEAQVSYRPATLGRRRR